MIIIVMGVMGSGKTTVGRKLAEAFGCPFFDADDFHPDSNREKMSRGMPLTDADRRPWLEKLAVLSENWHEAHARVVLACSALKQAYRDLLARGAPVKWVYLKGSEDLIRSRLQDRRGHFASPATLKDQFAALEEPADALTVDIRESPDRIVGRLCAKLQGE